MKNCKTIDLGLIGYREAAVLQQRLVAARKLAAVPDLLLFCEHPHVITLGRNGKRENLRVSEDLLSRQGRRISSHQSRWRYHLSRPGPDRRIPYSGPERNSPRRGLVRAAARAVHDPGDLQFGIEAFRVPGCTGVWVQPGAPGGDHLRPEEKLASIGVHISRWVTSHGFAYNVSTDLRFFDLITPCGIADCRVTSLEKLLGRFRFARRGDGAFERWI